ncbi:MAG: autotransporter domain-containing protein, partial [Rhizobiaceae bacterium]|nr:autotransporter domain-containing protein [Rhizobiaceae bacterium]
RSRNAITQDARNSDGDIDTFTAGFYGGTEFGNAHLRFAGLFSQHTLETSREVEILNLKEIVLAEYDATSWQVSAETGYHIETGSMEWEPFARLSHIGMDIDGFSEEASGLGLTALTAPSEEHSTTFGLVGVRSSIAVSDWIKAHGMVGWRGAWGDTDPTSTLTFNGSSPFIVTGAPISENAFVGEFGAVAQLSPQAAMHVSYTGLQSEDGSDHGIRAKLMMRF